MAKRRLRHPLAFGFDLLACGVVAVQAAWPVDDCERAIAVAMHFHLGLHRVRPVLITGNPQAQRVEAHTVVVTECALEALIHHVAPVRADERPCCSRL